ncbi:MAG: hypothetical protein ACAI44_05525 [Candidatus Sericytochromatia bacterium]
MSNLSVNTSIQTQPVQSAAPAKAQSAPAAADNKPQVLLSEDQLMLQHKQSNIKNAVVGIATIGGMLGGAGTMLMAKSTTGMAVGMGIMGLGLLSGRIANGKDIGSGAVAFVGAGASLGIGVAIGAAIKQPLVGAAIAGAGILGTLALSKALKED